MPTETPDGRADDDAEDDDEDEDEDEDEGRVDRREAAVNEPAGGGVEGVWRTTSKRSQRGSTAWTGST